MARMVGSRGRRGIAAVEAAIFFPLLILLVFGMIEYGWLFLKLQCINNAAREGVRVAVREGATANQSYTAISQVMSGCSISPFTPTSATGAGMPNVGASPGVQITCTVTIQYADVNLLHISLFPVPTQLTGTATMLKEGP